MILNLIPIGLLGVGSYSTYLTFIKKKELDDKIQTYPIYLYPDELNKISSNISSNIIKIPGSQIDSRYLIGEISLEKITPIISYTKKRVKTDYFSNKYIHILVEERIESRELIKRQLLFPSIYKDLNLDKNLLLSNEIKVLFDNVTMTTSETNANYKQLFNLYETDIKKNIPTYFPDLIPNIKSNQLVELKKNYLGFNKDLYLIVNKNGNPVRYDIQAMSDSKEKIIDQALSSDIQEYKVKCILSILLVSLGLASGFANFKHT